MAYFKELMKKLKEDNSFVEELRRVKDKVELLEKLKSAGFELSNDNLDEIIKVIDESELSEDELENVSGGIRPPNPKDCRMY